MRQDGKIHIQKHVALQPSQSTQYRCAASIRYEQHDPASLEVELLYLGSEEERGELYRATRAFDRNLLKLHAVNDAEESINLLGLSGWSGTISSLTLKPQAIEVGIDRDAASNPVDVHFTVALQPSGILVAFASHFRDYTGRIEVKREDAGSIVVETSIGPIEALEAYDYLEGAAFGDRVTHQVQRARLMGKVQLREGESLRALHDTLLEEVASICRALSLCYRQPVDAYEIEYLCRYPGEDVYKRSLYRRKWHSSRTRHPGDELIHASNLRDGGLSLLVRALKEHRELTSLKRGIGFLSASHDDFLETAYFMAFSAMETIVNAVSDKAAQSLMASSIWKKVQPRLRNAVTALEADEVVSAEVADNVRAKLAELRRTALTSKIANVAKAYSIKTSDLWTMEGFDEGIRQAAELRNGLFHAADPSDAGLMDVNLVRIQAFTERLILAALSWPDDRCWVWRDQQLRRIIQPRDPEFGETEDGQATGGQTSGGG